MGMAQEFKTFVLRGNVLDLAVGVVIGAAFGKIVSSLVGDVIMPPVGLALGGVDFSQIGWVLKPAMGDKPAVVLGIGMTAVVGLFFGMYPAMRAAALDPIEALRKE